MSLFDELTAAKGYFLYDEHPEQKLGIPIPATGPLADLFGIKSDHLLELYDYEQGQTLLCAVALPQLSSMQVLRPSSTTITHTLGYLPVREHSRNRTLQIQLRGPSGLAPRQGHDREGKLTFKRGPELLREFDAFLDRYQQLCQKKQRWYQQTTTSIRSGGVAGSSQIGLGGPFMVFRSFSNGIHVRVEPINWTVTQDTRTARLSYSWVLELRAYAADTPTKGAALFGKVQDVASLVSDFVAVGSAAIGAVTNAVDSVVELATSFRAPLQAAAQAMSSFNGLMSSVGGISDIPRQYMSDVNGIVSQAVQSVELFRDGLGFVSAGGGISSQSRQTERLLGTLQQASTASASAVGATGGGCSELSTGSYAFEAAPPNDEGISGESSSDWRRRPGQLPTFPVSPDREPTGIRVSLPQGSSLSRLAQHYYGDSSQWWRIANANGMQSAYLNSDGSPISPGALLLIPLSSTALAAAVLSPTQDMGTDPFGTDLYLDPATGDLEVLGDDVDVRLVRHADNLEQAIRNRLLNTQRQSALFPSYGLPEFVGTPTSAAGLGFFASQLNLQLNRDPRVLEVSRMVLSDEGDGLTAYLEVAPTQGQKLEIIVPL